MMPEDFNRLLGEHLRRLRAARGLSLRDVEAASGGELKASVLGAYERGERQLTVARLARLAELYGVPLWAAVPATGPVSPPPGAVGADGVTIDLSRLERAPGAEERAVARYARAVQAERRSFGPRVTLRRDDLRALAAALDVQAEELARRIEVAAGGQEAGGERSSWTP